MRFLPALFSLGIHGAMAAFLFYPPEKVLQDAPPLTIQVQWERGGQHESQQITASKPQARRHCEKRKLRSNPEEKLIKTGLLRRAFGPPRNDALWVGEVGHPHMSGNNTGGGKMQNRTPHTPLPKYPWICRKRGQEGRVSLLVQTNQEGRVIKASLRKSSGHHPLDQSALEAVKSWTLAEGSCQKVLAIAFRLKG